jgi:predicted nucleic acid-binding Zn ribbon protein
LPLYEYQVLNDKGEATGEIVEFLQRMSDPKYTQHPQDGRPLKYTISTLGMVDDGKPAWERCTDVRNHIRSAKPKYVSDTKKGIRERFDPRKHG